MRYPRLSLLVDAPGALGLASLEAVLESSGHILEVAGSAGADGLSSLRLLGPVVCTGQYDMPNGQAPSESRLSGRGAFFGVSRTLPGLSSRVAASSALMLLDVKRATT